MTAHVYSAGVTYFSVPKCACTSMKMMFFKLQNDFEFQNFVANDIWYHVHRFYRSVPFSESKRAAERNPYRLTVIRSPVGRLESCYKHWVASDDGRRVMKVSANVLVAKGVPPAPNWDEFIEHLDVYRSVLPNIAHHTETLSHFLGTDPSYFDAIYPMSRIGEAVTALREKTGKPLELKHYNETQSTGEFNGADDASKAKINAMFAEDFETFGKYF